MQTEIEQFAGVCDSFPAAVLLVTDDGRVEYVNRKAQEHFPALARPPAPFREQFDLDGHDVRAFLSRYARAPQPLAGRLTARGPEDGPANSIAFEGSLYRQHQDDCPALLTIVFTGLEGRPTPYRDTHDNARSAKAGEYLPAAGTKGKAEQEKDRLASAMHAQRLESLGLLAGGIAHDFNNVLTSILGNADLARQHLPYESPAGSYLDSVVAAALRASGLTQQLLAYSGKGRFLEANVDINTLIRDTHDLLRVSTAVDTVIRYRLAETLPCIKADPSQMQQILMNLIINADEAIGDTPGTITISTGRIDCDAGYLSRLQLQGELKEGECVYVNISDDGGGMPAEVRERIFEPFFSTKAKGHGLGLAAVIGIVSGHGGAAEVYSEPGCGTTFKLLFPAVAGEASEVTNTETSAPVQEAHVLVADDDEFIREFTKNLFEKMGMSVELAADGQEAVDLFRTNPGRFDLVVLDMTMPVLGGRAVFREMRSIAPDVPVLLVSGHNEQIAVSELAGRHHVGFLQKPFTLHMMRRAAEAVIKDEHYTRQGP